MEIKAVIQQPVWNVWRCCLGLFILWIFTLCWSSIWAPAMLLRATWSALRMVTTWEESKGQVEEIMSVRSWPGERETSKWTKCDRVSKLGCMAGPTDGPLASVSTVTARNGSWGYADKGGLCQQDSQTSEDGFTWGMAGRVTTTWRDPSGCLYTNLWA